MNGPFLAYEQNATIYRCEKIFYNPALSLLTIRYNRSTLPLYSVTRHYLPYCITSNPHYKIFFAAKWKSLDRTVYLLYIALVQCNAAQSADAISTAIQIILCCRLTSALHCIILYLSVAILAIHRTIHPLLCYSDLQY